MLCRAGSRNRRSHIHQVRQHDLHVHIQDEGSQRATSRVFVSVLRHKAVRCSCQGRCAVLQCRAGCGVLHRVLRKPHLRSLRESLQDSRCMRGLPLPAPDCVPHRSKPVRKQKPFFRYVQVLLLFPQHPAPRYHIQRTVPAVGRRNRSESLNHVRRL